jgi:dTDP-4-dehydrorhamnose 3,5-epimerase
MKTIRFDIEGPVLIVPKKFEDERGYFYEAFKDSWFRENIEDVGFVQDNQSLSRPTGTVRGLHYQVAPVGQGKLVRCIKGSIFDVAVDIRPNSPTFGKWISAVLTANGAEQLWIPNDFAHGFCTLEPDCEVFYKCTNPYSLDHDRGLAFDDPDIGIIWPTPPSEAILSEKDRKQPRLSDLKL